MVSDSPALVAQRATTEVERATARSLRVLRRYGQFDGVVTISLRSQDSLAEVALPPQPPPVADLGGVLLPPPALPAGPRAHFSFDLHRAANP